MNVKLVKIVMATHNYNNYKSIEEFAVWELRESLSHIEPTTLSRSMSKNQKSEVDYIVASVLSTNLVDWTSLTLLQEASIQRALIDNGYEIRCYALDIFPTSVTELLGLLIQSTCSESKVVSKSIWITMNNYSGSAIAVVTVGYIAFFFDIYLLLTAILVSHLLSYITQILDHDWCTHRYILPKNSIINILCRAWIMIMTHDPNTFPAIHMAHHVHWLNDKDPIHTNVTSSGQLASLLNVICSFPSLTPAALTKPNAKLQIGLLLLTYVTIWIVFGFTYVVYFCFLSKLWHNALTLIPDITLYALKKQQNFPWLWPLILRDAWHYEHHIKYHHKHYPKIEDLFHGPSWLKYLNFEYYFMKLFFKGRKD
jgi:hypothetical protein